MDLSDDAEAVRHTMALVPPREPLARLRPSEEVKILGLAAERWTQERIAAEIGCSQSTVSRTLAAYEDTRVLARKHLEARALDLAEQLTTEPKPEISLKLLQKIGVIPDDDSGHVGVTVIIGSENHPAIEADSVQVEVLAGTALSRNGDEDR